MGVGGGGCGAVLQWPIGVMGEALCKLLDSIFLVHLIEQIVLLFSFDDTEAGGTYLIKYSSDQLPSKTPPSKRIFPLSSRKAPLLAATS